MAKTRIKSVVITVILLAILACAIMGTYAVYSAGEVMYLGISAKAFNTSYSAEKGLPIPIWLGEENSWYLTAENVNESGKASELAVSVAVEVLLKRATGFNGCHGLTITIEEFSGAVSNEVADAKNWESITDGTTLITSGAIKGQSRSKFNANKASKKLFRVRYWLPDNEINASKNGFYSDNTSLLKVRSAIDVKVSFSQAG